MRTAFLLMAMVASSLSGQPGSVLPQPEPNPVMIGVSIAPLALSGRVWLPNGVPRPEAVLIEYSGPSGSFEVWTDVHGRFSIPVEKFALPPLVNRTVPNFNGTRLHFKVPGVAEQTVALDRIQTVEDLKLPDVRLVSITPQSVAMLSNGSYGAPAAAHKLYQRGVQQYTAGKSAEALASFDRAIAGYPQYAAAYEWKGRALEKLGRRDAAIEAYQRAAAADPRFAQPLIELATLAAQDQNSAQAVIWAERANHLAPDSYPEMYLVSAVANYILERYAAAEKAARSGLAADRDRAYPGLHSILGKTLHATRQYAGARAELMLYLAAIPNAADATEIRALIVECENHLRL